MFKKKFLLLIAGCAALSCLALFATTTYATSTPFSFTLSGSALTSAGIYAGDGMLVKTLWSGVTYTSGTHNAIWDGTDDAGRLLPNGNYTARVLSDNVAYDWEGVIGNTSDAKTGSTVYHAFQTFYDMTFVGSTGYYATNYNEQSSALGKFSISNAQSKTAILNKGADTDLVTSDGTLLYWSAQDANNAATTFVYATRVSDDSEVTNFTSGASVPVLYSRTYSSAIDVGNNTNSKITGLAVQKNGNYLFVAHANENQIDVLNKTTGALVRTLSYTAPGKIAIDGSDNLWMITGTAVAHYVVNTDGTLLSADSTLGGLVAPLALAVSPDGTTIAVADGGSSQQIKAYATTNGVSIWTYGQVGGYTTDPTVANDKFYFSDFDNVHTFISFAPDGSFWVGDPGNARAQHFAANRTFIDNIMYLPHFYSMSVDVNDSTRVFADYLEFHVDYSKSVGATNGSWALVKNWGQGIASQYDNQFFRLYNLTTLSNGRTYAFLRHSNVLTLVELPASGQLRFTGYETPDLNYSMYPDGSLRYVSGVSVGNAMTWHSMPLTGFDGSNNPTWGSDTSLASSPTTTSTDPILGGGTIFSSPETSSNVMVSFDGSLNNGYHLGAVAAGGNKWLWRESPSTYHDYQGEYPKDNTYDIGNSVQYAGSKAIAIDRSIFWGYHGEFWKNTEVNKWNQVYDDGLFVGQFGTTGYDTFYTEAGSEMAGNSFAASVVHGTDGNVYMYMNDESVHGGIHRWKITGLDTIAEQNSSITLAATPGITGNYFDGTDLDSANIKTARTDTLLDISSSPVGTALTDSTHFSARWNGFIKPLYSETYTIYAAANSGVRVWLDNTLLIDHWNNSSTAEFSGSLALVAGVGYPIRVEYYTTSTASLGISWSSASQTKQRIPTGNFYTSSAGDSVTDVDLMEGLPFNALLQNNTYGWSRSPTDEDTTDAYSKWWNVKTGSMTYNTLQPTQDVFARYAQSSGNYTVSRNLGINRALTSWNLSGKINYDNTTENENGGGSYVEVLDANGKIITRFYTTSVYSNDPILTVYANTSIVAQATRSTIERQVLWKEQPLSLSAANGNITVSYAGYTPVTTTVFDQTSDWQSPTTLRMYFFTNGQGYGRSIDLQAMRFASVRPTDDVAPPSDDTPPPVVSSGGGGGGGGGGSVTVTNPPAVTTTTPVVPDATVVVGCTATTAFNPLTGKACSSYVVVSIPSDCTSTTLFSASTGVRCPSSGTASTTPPAISNLGKVIVNVRTTLAMRATPAGTIIAKIKGGTVGVVLDIQTYSGVIWKKVQFTNGAGWLSSGYLKSTTAVINKPVVVSVPKIPASVVVSKTDSSSVTVIAQTIDVRNDPTGNILGKATYGMVATVIPGTNPDGWIYVQFKNGVTGYVEKRYVK